MRFLSRAWLLVLLLVAPGFAQEKPANTLRVLTYNIAHCQGMDRKLDLPRIAGVIAAAKADLVALQEVDVNVGRSGNVDQARQLAELLKMHVTFGKAMDYAGGEYGLAVLSRFPIIQSKTIALPFLARKTEPRALLIAQVKLADNGPAVLFACTHLEVSDEPTRLKQADLVLQTLAGEDAPVLILAGDFNARPGSELIGRVSKVMTADSPDTDLTINAKQPTIKIDWIFRKSDTILKRLSSKVLDETTASDHRPLLVEYAVGRP